MDTLICCVGSNDPYHNFYSFRQTIRNVVEAVEPGRAERMKAKRLSRRVYKVQGPNHIWHIDGNDKLKPYGFCISGCVDGFSRKIMWLKVGRTNKNPDVICMYFLDVVRDLDVLPSVVRMDRGTENVHIANVQRMLRAEHQDSLSNVCVMFGSSNHNQRIERLWLSLKQAVLQDFMDLFKDYATSGVVDLTDEAHRECLIFCFMPVIRAELESFITTWNNHRIRSMKSAACPSGIPNVLYSSPALHGFRSMSCRVNRAVFENCSELHAVPISDYHVDFEEWALTFMLQHTLAIPTTMAEGQRLFSTLFIEICSL